MANHTEPQKPPFSLDEQGYKVRNAHFQWILGGMSHSAFNSRKRRKGLSEARWEGPAPVLVESDSHGISSESEAETVGLVSPEGWRGRSALVSKFYGVQGVVVVAVTIWKSLMIDRIHMSVKVGDKNMHGLLVSVLQGLQDSQSDLVPHGKIKITYPPYITRLHYYPTKARKIAELEVGVTKSKHRYFRLSLFPTKFKPGEFEHFVEVLSLLSPITYQQLYETGKVSYIELAADSLSHTAHSFIPFRPKCGHSTIYIDEKGELGTTYLGSVTSALRFRVYDKHKQQVEQNIAPAHQKQTRFEAISRHTGLVSTELVSKMVNPFMRLEVADLHAARQITLNKRWQEFLNRCLALGSATALTYYPKQRKQYAGFLRKASASWWKPEKVWTGLPQALAVIAP